MVPSFSLAMHIPDTLSPAVCGVGWSVSLLVLTVAYLRSQRRLGSRLSARLGLVAAFVFAAQMINFPIPGAVSGHLLGGVLAAAILGPWAGMLAIAVVLTVQALLFADGGVTAWGANVLNMAVLGSGVGYLIYSAFRRIIGGSAGVVAGAVLAAWFSVMLAALAASVELCLSESYQPQLVFNAMLLVHTVIGLGEAAITGVVLSAVLGTRPDLIYLEPSATLAEPADSTSSSAVESDVIGWLGESARLVAAGLAVALVIAVFVSPWASENPDGLEHAIAAVRDRMGLPDSDPEPAWTHAPLPDYGFPESWGTLGGAAEVATSVAGAVGTLITFALAVGLAMTAPAGQTTHAHAGSRRA